MFMRALIAFRFVFLRRRRRRRSTRHQTRHQTRQWSNLNLNTIAIRVVPLMPSQIIPRPKLERIYPLARIQNVLAVGAKIFIPTIARPVRLVLQMLGPERVVRVEHLLKIRIVSRGRVNKV